MPPSRRLVPLPLVSLLVLAVAPPVTARAAKLAPVAIAAAERVPIVEELSLTGSLTSPRTARIASEVAGRIDRVAVDAGDRVIQGDVLVELDAELARLELAEADAAVRESTAELADAERRLAEASALARTRSFAETEVRSRAAEVERIRAVLERRRATRALRAALVERHALAAPFAGVVALREADLGEWVTPATPVLRLVAVDRLRLDLRVPQRYFPRIDAATRLRMRVDALPDEAFEARVDAVVPVSDPATRTFLVRAEVDNEAGTLAPGMSARAVIRLGTGREGVTVPRDAIIRYPDGRTIVWVAIGDGEQRTVEERRVETGLAFGDRVEITAGLDAGTPVVVRGNESLQQRQEVRISAAR